MNGLPLEVLVILGAVGVALALVVLVKFGRAIGRFVLVVGGIVAVVVVGLAILSQGAANFETAKAAQETAQAVKVSSVGQTVALVVGALVVGGLGVALVAALGVAGFFALRWQQAERRAALVDGWQPALQGRRRRGRALPRYESVVCVWEDDHALGDLAPVGDFDGWDYGEVEEWTSDGWQF